MEIRQPNPVSYAGKKFTARYQTRGYYDISASESGFELKYVLFEAAVRRSFGDVFFGTWLEKPVAFGAFEGGRLLGFVEGSPEGWNNRICTSSICVFYDFARGKGIGTRLIDVIQTAAEASGARMMILGCI